MKKIIVAGGGHGGIAAAALLAKEGFSVTVIERCSRNKMGYDWTDIFDRKGFAAAGIPMPDASFYEFKKNMTFYSPSYSKPLKQDVPEDQLEIKMERRDIYNHIINHAESNGVKFIFDTEVDSPIILGNRVVGVNTSVGAKYADLVIDACGLHSPVRSNLPDYFGIQHTPGEFEQFYVYRAFFDKASDDYTDDYKLTLLPENILGISWVAVEDEYTDVLIGRFEPFDIDEVNRAIQELRKLNPAIGNTLLRGGRFVNIPVRQPLSLMVANGYAAIGDSAFMTVPIIGSGIANSFKAAAILAETIKEDKNCEFSAETLWAYQKTFFKKLGNGLAPLGCVKLLLTRLTGPELNYIFEAGILKAEDMTIGADDTSLGAMFKDIKPDEIFAKAKGVIGNKAIMQKILKLGGDIVKCMNVTSTMPIKYNKQSVLNWSAKYNKAFTR